MNNTIYNINRKTSKSYNQRPHIETRNLINKVEDRIDWFFQDLNELIDNQITKK